MNKLRWGIVILLLAGFPAWFVWWIDAKYLVVYLYALILYIVVTGFAIRWAVGNASP